MHHHWPHGWTHHLRLNCYVGLSPDNESVRAETKLWVKTLLDHGYPARKALRYSDSPPRDGRRLVFEENLGIVPSAIGRDLFRDKTTTQAKGAACTTLLLSGIRLLHPCYPHMAASRSMQLFKLAYDPITRGQASRLARQRAPQYLSRIYIRSRWILCCTS